MRLPNPVPPATPDPVRPVRPVTIVVPCYNEEQRLPADAFRFFAARQERVGILFVNDGSTDGTRRVLDALCAENPAAMAVLHLTRNSGKAEAVRKGVQRAFASRAQAVGYWDADLATPLEEIPNFLAILDSRPSIDVVIGARVQLLGRRIVRKPLRHYLGRVFATTASTYLRLGIYDTQCGAKLFRGTPTVRSIFRGRFVTRWLFDVELLVRFLNATREQPARDGVPGVQRIYEVSLQRWEDVGGSKVRSRDFAKAIGDFARIVLRYKRP